MQATVQKWMTIPDMGYVIASRYNVVLVCLSLKQNITIFPLRSRPPSFIHSHRIICIGHVYRSHFVQVRIIMIKIMPKSLIFIVILT